jgi:two-component system sensor histidine kinase ChiS
VAQQVNTDTLSSTLQSAASRAAEVASGGASVLFTVEPLGSDDRSTASPRLRSAAGFDSPDSARAAASAALESVYECLNQGAAAQTVRSSAPSDLGPRAAGGLLVIPLVCAGRLHGALAIACPSPPDETTEQRLSQIATSAAMHLDHSFLDAEVSQLRQILTEKRSSVEAKSDELLQLSEDLFAQDIELLRSNEKLAKIEKLKSDFIEKMSRELRTPLNSIIEATISVLAGENDRLSENAKQSLRRALDEGTAFQRTLQNILDLWRVKQGELPVELQEVNIVEVVEEAIFSVQDTLDDKPVTIEKAFPDNLPKVRADLAKTNQILFLLLDNSAKFTHQGQITIRAYLEAEQLVCEVEDTGIGICPDDQQFIFDEFFQVDELSSTKYRGAGLGLALVRDLLVLLDGDLSLTSEVGKGTTVTFRLPIQGQA